MDLIQAARPGNTASCHIVSQQSHSADPKIFTVASAMKAQVPPLALHANTPFQAVASGLTWGREESAETKKPFVWKGNHVIGCTTTRVSRIVSRFRAGCGTLPTLAGCRAVNGPEPSRHSRCLFSCRRAGARHDHQIIHDPFRTVKRTSCVDIPSTRYPTTDHGSRFTVLSWAAWYRA